MPITHPFAATPDSLDAFIADWRGLRLAKAAWTHGAHVAACAYYAFDHDVETTFGILKPAIKAFNVSVGGANTSTSGYHETLTRFWTLAIAQYVAQVGATSRWAAVTAALDRFGDDRELPMRAYSFDVVRDVRARAEWVPPDREVDGLPAVAGAFPADSDIASPPAIWGQPIASAMTRKSAASTRSWPKRNAAPQCVLLRMKPSAAISGAIGASRHAVQRTSTR